MKNAFKFHSYMIVTLLVVIWFSITACSNSNEDTTLSSNSTDNTQSIPSTMKVVIGYGYDITSKYANPSEIKAAVLDLNKLVEDNMVLRNPNLSFGEYSSIVGKEINEYQSKISSNLSKTGHGSDFLGIAAFSKEVKTNFGESRVNSSLYMFSTNMIRIVKDAYNIKDIEDLDKYLTERFKSDLESMTASKIIEKYGTHVMLGGVLGARLDYHYSIKKNSVAYTIDFETLVKGKADANLLFIKAGVNSSYETDVNFSNYFDKLTEYTKTVVSGGKPEYGQSIQSKQEYDAWINSIEGNEIWIDYYPNSLLPISELVTDNQRKSNLEIAIKDYLESNKIFVKDLPNVYETESLLIPGEREINDDGRFKQPDEQVYFSSFKDVYDNGISMSEMKIQGYKWVVFVFSLDIKEVNDGYQQILIYNTHEDNDNNNNEVAEIELETTPNGIKNDWVTMPGETKDISIDRFTEQSFTIRFSAHGDGEDTWKNRNMSVMLRFKK